MASIDTTLLKPELVFLDFEAEDRLDFFKKLGQTLAEAGYVKESWLDRGVVDGQIASRKAMRAVAREIDG